MPAQRTPLQAASREPQQAAWTDLGEEEDAGARHRARRKQALGHLRQEGGVLACDRFPSAERQPP